MANVRADRIYQDFEPPNRWVSEPGVDTLVVELPGFKKDQLRVQVTATRKLRLTGERPAEAGGNKWIRFRQELPLPHNFDVESISARFVNGKLYVEHPKEEPKPPATPPEKPPVARAGDLQPKTRKDDKQPVGAKTFQPRTIPEPENIGRPKGEKTYDQATEALTSKEEGMVNKDSKIKQTMVFRFAAVVLIVLLILLYARNAARCSWGDLKNE